MVYYTGSKWASIKWFRKNGSKTDFIELKIDTDLESENGWLSPDGFFYSCNNLQEHNSLQYTLEQTKGIPDLEEAGWIKCSVSNYPNDNVNWISTKDFTQAQINVVFEWCEKHEKPIPWQLKKDEIGKLNTPKKRML